MDSKPFWQSKTVVVNVTLVVLMAALAALSVIEDAGAAVTGPVLVAALIAALNVALRFVTSVPITVNNNSGPIANVGETFTGPATIGAVAGRDAIDVTTSRAVTPPVVPAAQVEPDANIDPAVPHG